MKLDCNLTPESSFVLSEKMKDFKFLKEINIECR